MRAPVRTILVFMLATTLVGALFVGPSSAAPTRLRAGLDGSKEVPGPGDPNGRGLARIKVNPAERRLCFTIRWKRIRSPLAAHIHRGVAGVAGPVRVTLFSGRPLPKTVHEVSGCVRDVPRALAALIGRRPARFYVNVHNRAFPDGAIRGQLRRAG